MPRCSNHSSSTWRTVERHLPDLAFSSAPSLAKVMTEAGSIDVTMPGNASYRVEASAPIGDENVAVPNDSTATNVIELSARSAASRSTRVSTGPAGSP
ncbi:MAG: hypothetical protein JO039_05765 [Solirubrobacterales bacterium]|nr:hypothetical protein [Solirubrobacterales bacterium]